MRSNMQVATKIFVAFWVSFYTLAKSQDCGKENIKYANVLKSDLLESYVTGVILKLKCVTGYVGLLKLECQNGTWIKSGRDCKKKACGHPGDTPNGHFHLTTESEFVFGATVEYTCNTGYKMASRINYRNCRSQGWDNAVPVCEVVKCPPISNIGDLIARGNTEEASYGDIIHFECSLNKMINGSEDIHCKENGQWSSPTPTCKEIKCLPPEIPHGITSLDKVYSNNYILQYSCAEGYKTRQGTSKCTKDGWTTQPACEEITCEYPYSEHLLNPQLYNSDVYKLTQKIQYHCKENYKRSTEYTTCTVEGWKPKPQCILITCEKPEIAHGRVIEVEWKTYTPGKQLQFQCDDGYEPQTFTVTCNQNSDWDELQNCNLKKDSCAETSVKNGFTHKVSKTFSYSCDSDYKSFNEQWWGVVICNKGQWSYAPLCISKVQCGQLPNVYANHNKKKRVYNNEETVKLECESVLCCFKCISGKWENQLCEESCGSPPIVENAVITTHTQEVKYECRKNYKMKGNPVISCNKAQWDKPPTCELNEDSCAVTSVKNGFTHQHSEAFSYSCDSDYKSFDEQWWGVVICNKGQWSYAPLCIPKVQCGQLPNFYANYNQEKRGYNNEETVELECESKLCCFKCISGKWEEQHCKESCGTPPIAENAVITSQTQQKVKYECRINFEIKKENQVISCNKRHWDKPPTCE